MNGHPAQDVPKIGHLMLGTVVKAYPHERAYLLGGAHGGPLAVLPHADADRPLRVGDATLAAVSAWRPPYLVVSQRSIHYVRRIAELVWSPLRADRQLALSRVAYQPGWPFAKVLGRVASELAWREAIRLAMDSRQYLTPRLVLVPREPDWLTWVRRALYPAPPEVIQDLRVRDDRTLIALIQAQDRGRILGPGGSNLRAAEHLLHRRIVLVADATDPVWRETDPLTSMTGAVASVDSFPFGGAPNGGGETDTTSANP